MSTIKDLKRWHESFTHCRVGYCCEQEAPGGKWSLLRLGSNSGVYGWNWTAYADTKNDTLYVSYYRNVPGYIYEK